jgi:tetratricopeptide (TPR) repeat protein
MFGFLKRLLYVFSNKLRRKQTADEIAEEKWIAGFHAMSSGNRRSGRTSNSNNRFTIKSEISYDAKLVNNCLALSLKKTNCIAWVEAPGYRYRDQIIEARFRLDAMGGYAAAGFMFRITSEGTYYMALISSKGYFRLDAVRNNMPLPLIGWTEVPEGVGPQSAVPQNGLTLTIIAFGSHLTLLIDNVWAAEINDSSISSGVLGFTLASYTAAYEAIFPGAGPEKRDSEKAGAETAALPEYTAQAFLEALSVDNRSGEVGKASDQWSDSDAIPAASRFRLAETFTAMAAPVPALIQLKKAWEKPGHKKAQRELLLALRLNFQLEQYDEAEAYADACLEQGRDSPEGREALIEKAKILSAEKKYDELKSYADQTLVFLKDDPILYSLLGHACWNLGDNENAAAAYDRAFELDTENGLPAKNAANVYELLGRKDEALKRCLAAGRAFLALENYDDLGSLISKLISLGADDWEAHALVGKWAFGIENWALADSEFTKSEELRNSIRPRPQKDPAVSFLRGLLLIREGRRREAFPYLEDAARFAPDYGLFQFRLAENRFILSGDAKDPRLAIELNNALTLLPENGWVNNFAAQVSLAKGDLDAAESYLKKAAAVLGDVPAIQVNRGVLAYLQGSQPGHVPAGENTGKGSSGLDEALKILDTETADDPEGLMANCAANLLVRSGKFDEADEYYRKALAAAPNNTEYLLNRASCLIELQYYGQADEILDQVYNIAPSPAILEMISYIAVKKGEFSRAESASRAALEMDSGHIPSLLSLGWMYCSSGRWDEAQKILHRLEDIDPKKDDAERVKELRDRITEGTTRIIKCSDCDQSWRVSRSPEPSPPIRLYAMPPDEYPAGSCLQCGKTWCIACAKKNIDENGRFVCPECGKTLKLIDEGLKKIVYDYALSLGVLNQ